MATEFSADVASKTYFNQKGGAPSVTVVRHSPLYAGLNPNKLKKQLARNWRTNAENLINAFKEWYRGDVGQQIVKNKVALYLADITVDLDEQLRDEPRRLGFNQFKKIGWRINNKTMYNFVDFINPKPVENSVNCERKEEIETSEVSTSNKPETNRWHNFEFVEEAEDDYNMYSNPPVTPVISPNLCPPTDEKKECCACREHVMAKHHIPIRPCVECNKYFCDPHKPGNTCEWCHVASNDHQNHGKPVGLRNYYQFPTPTAFFEDADGIKWSKNKGLDENNQDLEPIEHEIFSKGFTTKDNFYQWQLFTEDINTPWGYKMTEKDHHYNQSFFEFCTFDSIYMNSPAMVDLFERRWNKPMKFITNNQTDKKSITESVLRSVEPWNAKEIVCTFSGNSTKPKRVALSTPISWRLQNKKKQFIDTKRDINDLFNEDDIKIFNEFKKRVEWTINKGLKLERFRFGNDLITNGNGYVTKASLLTHQDYKEFDPQAVAITHIKHEIDSNSKWSETEQQKKFAFSGFMQRPYYQGMMTTTAPGITCTMGKKAGTEWYHMVPIIRSEFDATLQHRKWIGKRPK